MYWHPADEPDSKDTLIYIIRHESREKAARIVEKIHRRRGVEKGRQRIAEGREVPPGAPRVRLHEGDRLLRDPVAEKWRASGHLGRPHTRGPRRKFTTPPVRPR